MYRITKAHTLKGETISQICGIHLKKTLRKQ